MIGRGFGTLGLMVALVSCPAFPVAPAAAALRSAPAPLASVRALDASLSKGWCGEARVAFELADPLGGAARPVRGRVRVEAPDRVRLDFTTTGERITLRSDGGEWLQPASKQLLRIPAERARTALQWWRVLLPGSHEIFREDSLGGRRYALRPIGDGAAPIRIVVQLDARGLPARLDVEGETTAASSYRLTNWTFPRARGEAFYRTAAPPGFETVELP